MDIGNQQQTISKRIKIVSILTAALFGLFGYTFVQIYQIDKSVDTVNSGLASTTAALIENSSLLAQNILDLRSQINSLSNALSGTQQNIDAVKDQVGAVEQTVGSVSGTVGDLQKLVQLDPELLKKYSKVYFLNENYTPAHLTDLPVDYTYSNTRTEQFLTEAWPFLQRMMDSAKQEGVQLYVKSAYRSFAEQQSLKSSYSVTYGAGTANTFSADQGYSEHQLGTTIDLITTGLDGQLNSKFADTSAYTWLLNNAYKFGFEMSYPKGNDYYMYEPWHWRFVGIKLAIYLHNNNANFYDMDQRAIDEYLIDIFDQN